LLVDRDRASADETRALIEQEGGRASTCEADVTREDDCREIARVCVERYGRIDVLHNNVGIAGDDDMTIALREDAWQRILDTNLKSMFLTSKHVLPSMRGQMAGVITNISSTASLCWPRPLAYKVSKAGVNTLTQHLALDNARYGVRANAILPGLIDTPMAIEHLLRPGQTRDELRAERAARVPLAGEPGNAWDVAKAAVFLASDDARYITGVLLPVDGGMSARVG
jgi:NAD(P)-dependent dehydrogenase (short-subunit alcohol dehydrogenase family)